MGKKFEETPIYDDMTTKAKWDPSEDQHEASRYEDLAKKDKEEK